MTRKRDQQGFTLIEIIVVIALIGIITAALIPQFATMTMRSRMKVDIQSVKTLQEQIDIYYVDNKEMPGDNLEAMISTLVEEDYLKENFIDAPHNRLHLETDGAEVVYDFAVGHAKLKVSPQQYEVFQDGRDKENWLLSS